MADDLWVNARVRDSSIGIPEGTKVLVAISRERHTSIGICWWVYDGQHLRQVSEAYGGRGIYKIVLRGTVFSDQERMRRRFSRLHASYATQRYKPAEKPLVTTKKCAI